MSAASRPCPFCPGSMEIPPGYIEELVAAKRSQGLDIVEDEVYRQRLEACARCVSSVEQTLCRRCGCFVQVRALSALRGCPHPGGDRWRSIDRA